MKPVVSISMSPDSFSSAVSDGGVAGLGRGPEIKLDSLDTSCGIGAMAGALVLVSAGSGIAAIIAWNHLRQYAAAAANR